MGRLKCGTCVMLSFSALVSHMAWIIAPEKQKQNQKMLCRTEKALEISSENSCRKRAAQEVRRFGPGGWGFISCLRKKMTVKIKCYNIMIGCERVTSYKNSKFWVSAGNLRLSCCFCAWKATVFQPLSYSKYSHEHALTAQFACEF